MTLSRLFHKHEHLYISRFYKISEDQSMTGTYQIRYIFDIRTCLPSDCLAVGARIRIAWYLTEYFLGFRD